MFKNNGGILKIQSGGETIGVPLKDICRMNSFKVRNSVSKGGGYGGKNFMIRRSHQVSYAEGIRDSSVES